MGRFVPNPTFRAELEADPQFVRGLAGEADEIARQVKAVAPKRTGYYVRHVRGRGTRVQARDPFAHILEYGSVNSPVYAPLRKGVRAAGHRFYDPGKARN